MPLTAQTVTALRNTAAPGRQSLALIESRKRPVLVLPEVEEEAKVSGQYTPSSALSTSPFWRDVRYSCTLPRPQPASSSASAPSACVELAVRSSSTRATVTRPPGASMLVMLLLLVLVVLLDVVAVVEVDASTTRALRPHCWDCTGRCATICV